MLTKRSLGESTGVLGGVPIAIKDNFCTKGIKTTAGSKMLHSYVPPFESTVTSRLESAGAISVGKTNMDEFGMGSANIYSAYGATISPWSAVAGEDVSAGGSSGGSAAALASSTCFAYVGLSPFFSGNRLLMHVFSFFFLFFFNYPIALWALILVDRFVCPPRGAVLLV